jgi:phosphoribosyl 1,2-cyclic phosphodiesterase
MADTQQQKVVTRCPACGQRVRVPLLVGKRLVVKCPRGCPDFTFEVPPQAVEDGGDAVLRVLSLQSGSNGNCIYVEGGGARLLFDAGVSCKVVRRRLQAHGRDLPGVDAVLVSHDHSDHTLCAGALHRMHGLPLYMTEGAYRSAAQRIGDVESIECFRPGARLRFGGLTVETFPTPHDGAGCVAFVIECDGRRVGILTDLGHIFPGLAEAVSSLDAVVLESNYDPDMLERGRYPRFLKERIKGPGGHLSNVEAAELLGEYGGERLKWACLAHLSADNNTPERAVQTHRRVWADGRMLRVAGRHSASGVLPV